MNYKLRLISMLMVVCMLFSMASFTTVYAAETGNVSLSVGKTEVNVGDTVTVQISNTDLKAEGFGLYMSFDNSLLECTGITGAYDDTWMGLVIINSRGKEADDDASYADTVELTNSDGIFSFAYVPGNDTEIVAGTVATLTFTAKAAGTAEFILNEDTAGTNAFKGIAGTATLTIVDPNAVTETTVTGNIATYADANGWADATQYSTIVMDDVVTVTATGGGNTGKYYTNGENWRIYQTESPSVVVSAAAGYTIQSVTITYAVSNSGVLTYNGSNITSDTAVEVNASTITFGVGNTGGKTNGQVRITNIEVTYVAASGSGETPPACEHTNTSVKDAVTAGCTTEGHTGKTVCDDCGATVNEGEAIPATGHNYEDGACTGCGAAEPVGTTWTKVELADILATDTIAITMTKGETTWALYNANGTGSAPTAVVVTVSGNTMTSEDKDTLAWNIVNDNGNLIIYLAGSTESWLYSNDGNNGVRVGTNDNKTWTLDATSGYLKHVATSRYLGVYTTNPDWRAYTNTTGNTAGQTLSFWKLVDPNAPACEHEYDNACDADCNKCGETREVGDHVYDNACDADCNECGVTREVGEHVYDNACDADCNTCGATREVAGHAYSNACDADCNECGATRTPAAHVYDNDCDTDCNTCGAIREVGEHVYDNACDADCNECGATREVSGHTGGEATCSKLAVCSVCGKEYGELAPNNHKNTYIGAVFHPVGDGTHYQLRGCSDCGKKEVEKVIGTCSDETTKDHKCDDCDYVMSTCSGGTATCTAKAQCSTCGAEYGDVDKTNHTGEIAYTDNEDGTHSATYNCCGGAYVTNESHNYTTGTSEHTCICGKVETFTVTYNPNDGYMYVNNNVEVESYTFTYAWNESVFAKADLVNKYEFYVYLPSGAFAGWNTKADGTGTAYAMGDKIVLTEDIILYAQYKEISVDGVALNSGEYLDCNGNVTTTKPEGGYAYYDNGTLTLHDFVGTQGQYATSAADQGYGVYAESDLIVVLEGSNVLKGTYCGISCYDLTIRETGSLTIEAEAEAIISYDTLTIESGNISLTGEYAVHAIEDITIRGGTVTGTGYLASRIGTLTLDGVTVIIPAGTTFGAYDFGDYTENCLLDSDGKPVTSFVIGACPHTEKSYTDNEDGSTHTVKCSCGEVLNAAEAHDFTNGDCICGAEKPETHVCTHKNYVTENGKHQSYCECGEPIGEAEDCSGGTATCQAKAVCEKCNTAYGELDKTNHTSDEEKYIQYGDSHAVVYACCNAHKRGENHTYDKTTHRCVCGALEKFTITLNANGGKFNSGAVAIDVSGEYGTDFTAIPEMPTKDGSALIGWTDESGNTIVLGNYKFTENITVYAQWCDHTKTTATDNGDGTHTVKCLCGERSYSEEHSYDKTPGTCVCGVKLTGWIGNSYYENGEKVTGWKEVDGAWYYFGENGYCTGLQRLPYFGDYAPNAEDLAYWEANKETSEYTDAESAVFYFGEDGKLKADYTGIVNDNGTLRYVVNGMIGWHVGFVKDGDNYYYFKGDVNGWGNVLATGRVYATRDCNAGKPVGGKCIYFFDDETGKLVKNEGIVEIEEVLYYFDSNNMLALGQGMVKLEDGYIYVRSSGKLALGNYWVTSEKANDLLEGGKLYDFGTDGCLTIDPSKNGVIEGVYYKEGVPYYAGLIKIGEDYYYVKSSGEVVTGWYYVTKTNGIDLGATKLYFGKDGKMQPIKNGIVEENDELYYYENNHMMCGAGLLKLEDENGVYYIYVRSSGKVQTGYFYITKTNDLEGFEAGIKLNFGEDGKYYPGK